MYQLNCTHFVDPANMLYTEGRSVKYDPNFATFPYRFRADTFLGDFFFSLGRERSCSKPSLSRSCLIAMLASCSINLNVSVMLRKTEKKCSLDRVLALIMSGRIRVAVFSSCVISTQRITSLAEREIYDSMSEEKTSLSLPEGQRSVTNVIVSSGLIA